MTIEQFYAVTGIGILVVLVVFSIVGWYVANPYRRKSETK